MLHGSRDPENIIINYYWAQLLGLKTCYTKYCHHGIGQSLLWLCKVFRGLQGLSLAAWLMVFRHFHQLWSSSRDVCLFLTLFLTLFLCLLSPFHVIFFRPFIGPQITWPDPGLSLVNPPSLPYGGGGGGWLIFIFFYFFFAQKPLVGAGDDGAGEKRGKRRRKKLRNLFKFVSVLLSASVERVGVSRMRDFSPKKIYVSVYFQQQQKKCQVYIGISILVIPDHMTRIYR